MRINSVDYQNFNAWSSPSFQFLDKSLEQINLESITKALCADRIKRIDRISPHHFVFYEDAHYGYTSTDKYGSNNSFRIPKNPAVFPRILRELEMQIRKDNLVINRMNDFEKAVSSKLVLKTTDDGKDIGWNGNSHVLFEKIIETYGKDVPSSVRNKFSSLISNITTLLLDKNKLLTCIETLDGEIKFVLGNNPTTPELLVSTNKFTLLPQEGEGFLPQNLEDCLEKVNQYLKKN